MKPSELFEALHALIGERVPLHIWGACGVGKSQIVAQVADDLGWQFLDIRAVQLDPVDCCDRCHGNRHRPERREPWQDGRGLQTEDAT